MPKKVIKKPVKIMTVPVARHNPKPASEDVVASLLSLEASPGWAIVLGILNDNIAYLEKCIIEKRDPISKEILKDDEIELLRIKRSLNIDLRDTPKNYSEFVQKTTETAEEFDPYYKTNQQIIEDNKRANRDDGR